MLDISDLSTTFRRHGAKLRLAGFAALATLGYGLAAPAPALAAPTGWEIACQDKAAPQGYGEMIRYNNCVRQRDCERLANTAGQTVMAMGCFGVKPDAPAAASRPGR